MLQWDDEATTVDAIGDEVTAPHGDAVVLADGDVVGDSVIAADGDAMTSARSALALQL